MVMRRQCAFRFPSGEACRMAPLKEGQFCWAHSPEHAQEAQEARKLGGMRKKREATVSLAYEFVGLESVADIRRLLEIAATDTLGQENNLARNRLLVYLALAALQALEKGDHEQRIAALEHSVNPHNVQLALPVFDIEVSEVPPDSAFHTTVSEVNDKENQHESR